MYSIQLTIIVLHVLGNWLIDNTDEVGTRQTENTLVTRSDKNFDAIHSLIFPLANTISKATKLSRMNLDVKNVRA